MKRLLALLICAFAILTIAPAAALAETSEQADQPGEPVGVTLTLPEKDAAYAWRLTDAYVISRVSFRAKDSVTIEPEEPAGVVILNWYDAPASYTVTQLDAAGGTVSQETITDRQLGRLIPVLPDSVKITVYFDEAGSLGGVAAYPADESLPDSVHGFLPAPEQADLLIVTAEPGMEWLQFGAVLPLYARENGMKVAVLYVSDYGKRARAYEALEGLYDAGYIEYPVFGGFTCDNYDSYKMAADGFDKKTLTEYLESEFTALNPKVIVTHSPLDASGAHSLVAECTLLAAGVSEGVQKVYTFGPAEGKDPTVLDMNAPLNAYEGKTAAEVAKSAYALHAARRVFRSEIDTSGSYTLAYTSVGEDQAKNDLFEHIATADLIAYAPVAPSPSPTPETTETPVPTTAQETAQTSAPQSKQGLLDSLGFSYPPALWCAAAGAALSALSFVMAYRRIAKKRGKGDAVCLCLAPLAIGLAASAILAGAKAEQVKPVPQTTAVASAASLDTPNRRQAKRRRRPLRRARNRRPIPLRRLKKIIIARRATLPR